jgi:putative hydrolase of the HAD superfamily
MGTTDRGECIICSLGCDSHVGDRLEECFRAFYPKRCKLDTDAVQTFQTLRADGMKLALVTNGPVEWQSRKIECMNIARFFDSILISEAEGVQKPDARIFGRALERCDVAASETIFVGDHPENDIAGSAAAGLTPVWKRVPYWDVPTQVYRIDRLSELLPIYRKQI